MLFVSFPPSNYGGRVCVCVWGLSVSLYEGESVYVRLIVYIINQLVATRDYHYFDVSINEIWWNLTIGGHSIRIK